MLSRNVLRAFCRRQTIRSHLLPPCTANNLSSIRTPAQICPSQAFLFSSPRWSSSSTRWKNRQGRDSFAREARVQGLKSRAAFKLLEIDAKYRLFKKGQTVVDLGYAPGSWSQVAVERTKPHGRIVGIDIIPAQPPKGVSTIQGNFLSAEVREEVKRFLSDPNRGRARPQLYASLDGESPNAIIEPERSYIDLERHAGEETSPSNGERRPEDGGGMVDIVLSDMSAPWEQTTGFWKRSLSDPYFRMMNTSGINFKDHAGSMDLCAAALTFAFDTLRVGGHFIAKFYDGAESKELEMQLRKLFGAVHREKPESSRSESKEAYFVALRRKKDVTIEEVTNPN
ncbi:rRNA methyltransferase 2, mitochondrial [Lachnellula subtilissima]|uniref:rRNA methyltransferase 2, mitochondrial n=1 Tax=Lachnellula subtilissima TaxID=602034 RepID=A0A8H8RSP1_9HELO|nr:rRNA methyltransferase 2, mitochondrial [Lachnellula subtilissima]